MFLRPTSRPPTPGSSRASSVAGEHTSAQQPKPTTQSPKFTPNNFAVSRQAPWSHNATLNTFQSSLRGRPQTAPSSRSSETTSSSQVSALLGGNDSRAGSNQSQLHSSYRSNFGQARLSRHQSGNADSETKREYQRNAGKVKHANLVKSCLTDKPPSQDYRDPVFSYTNGGTVSFEKSSKKTTDTYSALHAGQGTAEIMRLHSADPHPVEASTNRPAKRQVATKNACSNPVINPKSEGHYAGQEDWRPQRRGNPEYHAKIQKQNQETFQHNGRTQSIHVKLRSTEPYSAHQDPSRAGAPSISERQLAEAAGEVRPMRKVSSKHHESVMGGTLNHDQPESDEFRPIRKVADFSIRNETANFRDPILQHNEHSFQSKTGDITKNSKHRTRRNFAEKHLKQTEQDVAQVQKPCFRKNSRGYSDLHGNTLRVLQPQLVNENEQVGHKSGRHTPRNANVPHRKPSSRENRDVLNYRHSGGICPEGMATVDRKQRDATYQANFNKCLEQTQRSKQAARQTRAKSQADQGSYLLLNSHYG